MPTRTSHIHATSSPGTVTGATDRSSAAGRALHHIAPIEALTSRRDLLGRSLATSVSLAAAMPASIREIGAADPVPATPAEPPRVTLRLVVRVDDGGRVQLGALADELGDAFAATVRDGGLILTPAVVCGSRVHHVLSRGRIKIPFAIRTSLSWPAGHSLAVFTGAGEVRLCAASTVVR